MTIALLGRMDSDWLGAVAARCGFECARLDLESALHRGRTTLDGPRVEWDGFDLRQADAVLVERGVFAWPQPGNARAGLSARAEREARALLLSALWTAAESVPVIPHPRHAHLCVAPALALERCERAAIPVHPWTIGARPPRGDGRVWLDVGGRDLRYEPREPEPGEPGFSPEAFAGPLWTLLAFDGVVLGARRHVDAAAWQAGAVEGVLPGDEVPDALARLARGALEQLELPWLELALRPDPDAPTLVHLLPDADLGRWDLDLNGAASRAAATLLESKIGVPR